MRIPHFPVPSWRRDGKYNLENINRLLEILDNPHLKLPPVIHIAGTNDKGSSVAMLKRKVSLLLVVITPIPILLRICWNLMKEDSLKRRKDFRFLFI